MKYSFFYLRNVFISSMIVISILLFFSAAAWSQNKVVVVPLFDDSSDSQSIDLGDYRVPGNCTHTYKGYSGDFRDPYYEITTTYTEGTSKKSERYVVYGSSGDIDFDITYDENGSVDNIRDGYYSIYDPPQPSYLSKGTTREIGKDWTQVYTKNNYDSNNNFTSVSGRVSLWNIIAIEDIVIEQKTYRNCLKIYRDDGSYHTFYWYAKGIGLIKRVRNGANFNSMFELKSYTCE